MGKDFLKNKNVALTFLNQSMQTIFTARLKLKNINR